MEDGHKKKIQPIYRMMHYKWPTCMEIYFDRHYRYAKKLKISKFETLALEKKKVKKTVLENF